MPPRDLLVKSHDFLLDSTEIEATMFQACSRPSEGGAAHQTTCFCHQEKKEATKDTEKETYQKSITEPGKGLVCQLHFLSEKKNHGRFGSCVEPTLSTSEGFLCIIRNR